ncbi:hypothetical protein ABZ357_30085 [Streptomyces sp. NPDC005917]|uniref:hypothetical protein n=1 Tax=unclassified Streptomyces TaxID=2593676 RepID=UPI00340CA575
MSSTFKYRFRSPLGGLAADLTAEYAPAGAGDEFQRGFFLQIDRKVHLTLPAGIHWRDASWLSYGLAAHAPALMSRYPEGLSVRVTSFTFPLAHFRSEVAALAMDGWLRQQFDLPDLGLGVSFDAAKGSYTFRWGEDTAPFSDDLAPL